MTGPALSSAAALAALALVATALPGTGAQAAELDGTWRCMLNGNIPLGVVTISGDAYALRSTDVAWRPKPNRSDGDGRLTIAGATLTPVSGPLLTQFEVVGTLSGPQITWNNARGALFACRKPPA
jgi:hypothetical protein